MKGKNQHVKLKTCCLSELIAVEEAEDKECIDLCLSSAGVKSVSEFLLYSCSGAVIEKRSSCYGW